MVAFVASHTQRRPVPQCLASRILYTPSSSMSPKSPIEASWSFRGWPLRSSADHGGLAPKLDALSSRSCWDKLCMFESADGSAVVQLLMLPRPCFTCQTLGTISWPVCCGDDNLSMAAAELSRGNEPTGSASALLRRRELQQPEPLRQGAELPELVGLNGPCMYGEAGGSEVELKVENPVEFIHLRLGERSPECSKSKGIANSTSVSSQCAAQTP
mmetsp:Transcript_47956/g.111900  ORF Transcript_47956/g.111900 Transcript_47956/m.111900 type:complete len:215 (-) Transcript_47956:427-1071(-)